MNSLKLLLILLLTVMTTLPGFAQDVAIGEAFQVGTTYWITQQNSTVGKMVSRDSESGTHFVWTKGMDANNNNRQVYYNFCDDNIQMTTQDQLDRNDARIDFDDRSGYVSMTLHEFDNEISAIAFYHLSGEGAFAIDLERGLGAFEPNPFSGPPRNIIISTKGAVDRNGRMHVLGVIFDMMDAAAFEVNLWSADMGDDIGDWDIANPRPIEVTTGLSHHIAAATESDEVAIAWHHNILGGNAPDYWDGTTEYTMNNDLYLYVSPDGEEFEFDEALNLTNTIEADPERDAPYSYGDTLRPFNDVDMIYDGEVLHVVFSVRGFWADPFEDEQPPVERITMNESLIWHWDSESDSLTLVADGWYENEGVPGPQHNNVTLPSLGIDEDGKLYCVWRQVTEDDRNRGDYCYGEVMLSLSDDHGVTWSEAINLTETTTEGESEYVDELYPSLAEMVDDDLHISYLLAAENFDGINRMIYQRVAVEDLPDVDDLPMPRDGFQYHNINPASVQDDITYLPTELTLSAYPNPFNSHATLRYSLPRSGEVMLVLLDVTGRALQTQALGKHLAGEHSLSLDGNDLPTGIYFARLEVNGVSRTQKLLLVK